MFISFKMAPISANGQWRLLMAVTLVQTAILMAIRTTHRNGMLRTGFCACMAFHVIVYFLTAVDCDGRPLNCLTQSKACAYGILKKRNFDFENVGS